MLIDFRMRWWLTSLQTSTWSMGRTRIPCTAPNWTPSARFTRTVGKWPSWTWSLRPWRSCGARSTLPTSSSSLPPAFGRCTTTTAAWNNCPKSLTACAKPTATFSTSPSSTTTSTRRSGSWKEPWRRSAPRLNGSPSVGCTDTVGVTTNNQILIEVGAPDQDARHPLEGRTARNRDGVLKRTSGNGGNDRYLPTLRNTSNSSSSSKFQLNKDIIRIITQTRPFLQLLLRIPEYSWLREWTIELQLPCTTTKPRNGIPSYYYLHSDTVKWNHLCML